MGTLKTTKVGALVPNHLTICRTHGIKQLSAMEFFPVLGDRKYCDCKKFRILFAKLKFL